MKKSVITLLTVLAFFLSFGSYSNFETHANAEQMVWISTGNGKKYHFKNPGKKFGKGGTQWKQVGISYAKKIGYTASKR